MEKKQDLNSWQKTIRDYIVLVGMVRGDVMIIAGVWCFAVRY